ncbi:unnamed protein product [Adineta steineri]|uniref:DUF3800 domain-containing protein n=1 Tax=Adineta steineri TaxID=433720 RepID=A0A816F4V4_9BILA|nr:unnamed protein product [Adineta steineri]CAF1658213.1 unnamed protein product [Adineta steineri]
MMSYPVEYSTLYIDESGETGEVTMSVNNIPIFMDLMDKKYFIVTKIIQYIILNPLAFNERCVPGEQHYYVDNNPSLNCLLTQPDAIIALRHKLSGDFYEQFPDSVYQVFINGIVRRRDKKQRKATCFTDAEHVTTTTDTTATVSSITITSSDAEPYTKESLLKIYSHLIDYFSQSTTDPIAFPDERSYPKIYISNQDLKQLVQLTQKKYLADSEAAHSDSLEIYLPSPDMNKHDKQFYLLPNYPALHSLVARCEKYRSTSTPNYPLRIVHDDQHQFATDNDTPELSQEFLLQKPESGSRPL